MDSSSGKSSSSRFAICSGLHDVTHRRSPRCGLLRPFHAGPAGPATLPSTVRTTPDNRSCTYSRSRASPTSFAIFGRRARRSACHCAIDALYSNRLVRVEALRRNSREIRRRVTAQTTSDLTGTDLLRMPDRDVLAFGERQMAARHTGRKTWVHTASVAEPAKPNRPRHARLNTRILSLHPASD